MIEMLATAASLRYDGISVGDNIENRLYRIIQRERKAAQKARGTLLLLELSIDPDSCSAVVSRDKLVFRHFPADITWNTEKCHTFEIERLLQFLGICQDESDA